MQFLWSWGLFFSNLLIKINHQKGHYSDFKGDCSARNQLKVRLRQNGFMKSSINPKNDPKIWRISALCTVKTSSNFLGHFLEMDDFINSFWINLTFSGHPDVHSWYNVYKLCSVKKDTRLNQVFYLIKSSGIIFIFYLDFTWLYGSWQHQRI